MFAGLSYGGYVARGVVYHKAATIDGLLLCVTLVKANAEQARLPPRTPVVVDPTLAAPLGPGASLIVAQIPPVVTAVREVFTEVALADDALNDQLEGASPAFFEIATLPAPFGAPTRLLSPHAKMPTAMLEYHG